MRIELLRENNICKVRWTESEKLPQKSRGLWKWKPPGHSTAYWSAYYAMDYGYDYDIVSENSALAHC